MASCSSMGSGRNCSRSATTSPCCPVTVPPPQSASNVALIRSCDNCAAENQAATPSLFLRQQQDHSGELEHAGDEVDEDGKEERPKQVPFYDVDDLEHLGRGAQQAEAVKTHSPRDFGV